MSDEWIPVVSYSVGALTALLMGALVMRWTLNKLPFSSQLRKSFRTTHRFTAAAIGAMVVLGVVYAIIATSGGFVREGKGGWNPLIGLIQPGMLFAWHPLSMLAGTVIFFPAAFDAIAMRFDSKNQQDFYPRSLYLEICLEPSGKCQFLLQNLTRKQPKQ